MDAIPLCPIANIIALTDDPVALSIAMALGVSDAEARMTGPPYSTGTDWPIVRSKPEKNPQCGQIRDCGGPEPSILRQYIAALVSCLISVFTYRGVWLILWRPCLALLRSQSAHSASPALLARAPDSRLRTARDHDLIRRAQYGCRQNHRPMPTASPTPGVLTFPEADRWC